MNILIALLLFVLGLIIGGIVVNNVINQGKSNKKSIEKQAYTDPLTGGKNRHLFMLDLDKLIKKGKKFAICFLDLDGFKQINDTMGHDAGDELLIKLSDTFLQKLPKNACSYRLGGDEFSIVITDIKTTEDITNILDHLREELNVPFVIDNANISLEYSLGVSVFPEDSTSKKDLITYADDAMYYIKEHGKNDYYFHNKVLKAKLENRTKMERELKIAFENKQFGINFQPRISLKEKNKMSLEALLYWNHPVLGEIPSEYFIKQAEEMSLMIKLDEYVLKMACEKLNEIKEAKLIDGLSIAVNISNSHMKRKNFVKNLCDILEKYNISNGEIEIELTDDIDIKNITEYKYMFESLKNSGANIIINNLQVKHEAITLIKTLPIDKIKLVSKYVSKDSQIGKEILKDIIVLAKDLEYKVIVICVDEDRELEYAIRNGVDFVQGNLICKVIKRKDVYEFLNNYKTERKAFDNKIFSLK